MIIATTKISCPAVNGKRHAVTLHADGSYTCDCENGVERGVAFAGRVLLGMKPPEGVRGCGALVALAQSARSLLPLVRGSQLPDYGLWGELVFAYGKNPVFKAALDRVEREDPERAVVKRLLLEACERAGYRHALGKRRFRDEFRAHWDQPTGDLEGFMVSTFDDDPWHVPHQVGWKAQIADKGLAVLGGKVVCGRSTEDPTIFYAVAPHENGQGHWVRAHRLAGKRLVEVAA